MTFPVTSFYASLLTLLVLVLANIVTARRAKTGISILHGDDMTLALWIRRHGNLVENLPLALILMGLSEARGMEQLWLHAVGAVLVVGRLAHVAGLSITDVRAPLRIVGGLLTQLPMLAMAVYLLIPD